MSRIQLKCPKCGSDQFEFPNHDLRTTDRITCIKCRHVETYGRLVEVCAAPQALKLAEKEVAKVLKNFRL